MNTSPKMVYLTTVDHTPSCIITLIHTCHLQGFCYNLSLCFPYIYIIYPGESQTLRVRIWVRTRLRISYDPAFGQRPKKFTQIGKSDPVLGAGGGGGATPGHYVCNFLNNIQGLVIRTKDPMEHTAWRSAVRSIKTPAPPPARLRVG